MPLFDQAVPASFDGIEFLITSAELTGSYRLAEHVIPKRDGVELETNGRSLYIFSVSALFVDTSGTYPNLYPRDLTRLVSKFEQGVTGKLTLPGWGSYDCICANWRRSYTTAMTSGETVNLEFKERQDPNTVDDVAVEARAAAVDNSAAYLAKVRAEMAETPEDTSLLDDIEAAAQVVKQVRDAGDLNAQIYLAKVQRLIGLCEEAERTLASFKDPMNHPVFEAVMDLWYAAVTIGQDFASRQVVIATYTVPKRMTISDVSQAIYGNTSQVDDLVALNVLPDYLAIPPGTPVKYYPA